MPAALAKYFDKQVRAAVDDFGMIFEIGGGIDHAQHLDDVLDPVEIATKLVFHCGNQHQPNLPSVPVSFVDRQAGTQLALGHPTIRPVGRTLARKVKQITGAFGMNVVSEWAADCRQHDSQLLQSLFDAHSEISKCVAAHSLSKNTGSKNTADAPQRQRYCPSSALPSWV